MPRLYVLVLSGGAGTRLWPLSRRDRPKQFLNLLGDRSLLQDTAERVAERGQFRKVRIAATAAAERGHLVTVGITPEGPDTGFGYIEAADKLDIEAPVEVRAVKRFVEKPKREAAERMVAAGGHYWNAGMFVLRVEEILRAYEKHLPNTAASIAALRYAIGAPRYESVLAV